MQMKNPHDLWSRAAKYFFFEIAISFVNIYEISRNKVLYPTVFRQPTT